MIVEERYKLPSNLYKDIPLSFDHNFGFDGFGEVTYFRTYSRFNEETQTQETWLDTCVRVVEGVFSIRKDWYKKLGLRWRDHSWHPIAVEMIRFIYQMKFLPPGRGLWAMGSPHVFEVGSMALNNCAGTDIELSSLRDDVAWAMDALMCGCGVGLKLGSHMGTAPFLSSSILPEKMGDGWAIPDSREGWTESTRLLLSDPREGVFPFDYGDIRKFGEPIKRFGGVSSGPGPLMILHRRLHAYINNWGNGLIRHTRFLADVANATGTCVVSGNVRRGAEILIGSIKDEEFLNLKAPQKVNERLKERLDLTFEVSKTDKENGYRNAVKLLWDDYLTDEDFLDDRALIGGLSNNSVALESSSDFLQTPKLAEGILLNGEPGGLNMMNIKKYGRFGDENVKEETATLANPCGEIPLESKELCNVVEVFPTNCSTPQEFHKALSLATIYSQSVSLLMTHSSETNEILARNRRIGVSLTGVADWLDRSGAARVTRLMRDGYKTVIKTADKFARESGVPSPIRYTTVKPSGTVSQLAGVSSGMHFPTFSLAIRRLRVTKDSPLFHLLRKSNVPNEADVKDTTAQVFEFPINQGTTRPATKVSAWEQFSLLAMLQREWADNMVSCTVYFDKNKEGDQIEKMLGQFLPLIKSFSMLPHSSSGAFEQMPYEEIDKEEYEKRKAKMNHIDFSDYKGTGQDEKARESTLYCDNDVCEI